MTDARIPVPPNSRISILRLLTLRFAAALVHPGMISQCHGKTFNRDFAAFLSDHD
jgi:hypothetical protein